MNNALPSCDDGRLWALHLSNFVFPSITAADELGIFEDLAKSAGSAEQVASRLRLNVRAVRALLPVLASAGLLAQRLGRYHVLETAKNYLLPSSPFYWGPVFELIRRLPISHDSMLTALRAADANAKWDHVTAENPTNAWASGDIAPPLARAVAAYMNANSLAAASVAAGQINLSSARRLLDVGAGSGCFSIAFAAANPQLHCTLMDLKGMCDVAMDYVRVAGVQQRVDARAVDMFRQPWPSGYDAIFFSNIFHDWDFETCGTLARKAYDCLEPGGRVLVHEMLLDDTHDGPPTAVAFSMYMLLGTKGQQFTAAEIGKLLGDAGFGDVRVTPAHGDFAVVSARK